MKGCKKVRIIVGLFLGLIALSLLTWGIGKAYLDLIGQSKGMKIETANSAQTTGSLKSIVLVLPEAKFWTCQVGVFQNQINAQLKKEQLNRLGLNAEIINTSPCLVCIGLGHAADDLKLLKQTLLQRGISTLTKQIVLPGQTFRVAGKGAQLTADLLTNTNLILRDGFNSQVLDKEKKIWIAGAEGYSLKNLERLHNIYNQLRGKSKPEEQCFVGLELYFEYQRVINKLSGK